MKGRTPAMILGFVFSLAFYFVVSTVHDKAFCVRYYHSVFVRSTYNKRKSKASLTAILSSEKAFFVSLSILLML